MSSDTGDGFNDLAIDSFGECGNLSWLSDRNDVCFNHGHTWGSDGPGFSQHNRVGSQTGSCLDELAVDSFGECGNMS